MKRSYLRGLASVAVLAITLSAFIWYFSTHPEVRRQLHEVPTTTLVLLLGLYLLTVAVLALVFMATLRLCKLRLKPGESTLLTAYSSVINFFGPLQSGPAFRAVYLKGKYDVNLKAYALATLVYYAFFGAFSGLLLLSGLLGWWLILLMAIGAAGGLLVLYSPIGARFRSLDLGGWYFLALATLAQVCLMVAIYYTELHTITPTISLSQAIVYTGAANLALFVSLTPGAIGFRESFLLFSQRLHDIGPGVIVTANIIDRAIYITLMLILGVFIVSTHAKGQLEKRTKVSGKHRTNSDGHAKAE